GKQTAVTARRYTERDSLVTYPGIGGQPLEHVALLRCCRATVFLFGRLHLTGPAATAAAAAAVNRTCSRPTTVPPSERQREFWLSDKRVACCEAGQQAKKPYHR
ncbi:unnamed protein product, partial [Ectocarpus sp. 12 AP-2014]